MKTKMQYLFIFSLIYYIFFPYKDIHEDFKPYVDDFHAKLWERCSDTQYNSTYQISIKYGDTENSLTPDAIGWCMKKPLGFDIIIDRKFWGTMPTEIHRELLYHELLHCYLNQDHVENTIMNDSLIFFKHEQIEQQLDYFLEKNCKP